MYLVVFLSQMLLCLCNNSPHCTIKFPQATTSVKYVQRSSWLSGLICASSALKDFLTCSFSPNSLQKTALHS